MRTAPGMRCLLWLGVAAAAAGCGRQDAVDYCSNHYAFHAGHADASGRLDVAIAVGGELRATLMLPAAAVGRGSGEPLPARLRDPGNLLALRTAAAPCAASVSRVVSSAAGFEVQLSASCGPDNRLGRVEVALFDALPGLDEVVVSVTTPATAKRFGISRRCDKPIFKLD